MQKEYYDIKVKETALNIVNTQIESLRKKESIRRSVRVFDNGRLGISASKADISMDELEKKAVLSLEFGIPVEYGLPSGSSESWNTAKKPVSDSELVEMTETLISLLKKKAPEYIFSNKVGYTSAEKKIRNTEGGDYSLTTDSLLISLVIKKKGSGNIFDAFWGNLFHEKPDLEQFTDSMMEYLNVFDNIVDVDEGYQTVVFPEFTGALPFAFFEKHINGELFEKGASYFKDSLNKKVFSEKFSLYDLNLDLDNNIASPFDSEGYRREEAKMPIIENGIFRTPLYDLKRAAMFSRKPTGTSRRAYNGSPSIGSNFLWVQSNEMELKDLDRALMIIVSSGGDFQDNGSISMPVQLGYMIEKGRIMGRLPQMLINGSIDKMFGDGYIGALKDGMFNDIHKYFAMKMDVKKG